MTEIEKLDFSGVVTLADGIIAVVVKDESTGNWRGFPIWDREYYWDEKGHCLSAREKDIVKCHSRNLIHPELPKTVWKAY